MKLAVIVIAGLLSTGAASAQQMFVRAHLANGRHVMLPAHLDPEPRAEDSDGIRAYKLNRPSVQVPFFGQPFAGRDVPDGICDVLQSKSWDPPAGYKNSVPVRKLFTTGRGPCTMVDYYGPNFFGIFGQPVMTIGVNGYPLGYAPRWDGTPDWVPAPPFNYMDWTDPRYNPAMRNGG